MEEIQRLMHELDGLKQAMQEKQRIVGDLERGIQGYTVGRLLRSKRTTLTLYSVARGNSNLSSIGPRTMLRISSRELRKRRRTANLIPYKLDLR